MNDTNKTWQVGRLTRDAELKTAGNTSVCKFGIAVNEKYKETEYVNFFDVEMWGKFAEALSSYLKKGKQVAICGKLKQDRWEKDGTKRSRVKIVCQELQLLGSKQQESAPVDDDAECPF